MFFQATFLEFSFIGTSSSKVKTGTPPSLSTKSFRRSFSSHKAKSVHAIHIVISCSYSTNILDLSRNKILAKLHKASQLRTRLFR